MGLNLKGKNLGKGIAQRKDKRYYARFESKTLGKRIQSYFTNEYDAAAWLEEQKYLDKHGMLQLESNMSVSEWFQEWIKLKEAIVRPNTVRNYRERYEHNIQPVIGGMKISNVMEGHCTRVLVKMIPKYKHSTIIQTYITMGSMFKSAVGHGLIKKVPLEDGILQKLCPKEPRSHRVLTIEEQDKFLKTIVGTSNERQCRLLLNTGLRISELIALQWEDVDLKSRHPSLTVRHNLEYRHSRGEWLWGPPKSTSGYRTVPLTKDMVQMLKELKAEPSKITAETPEEFKDIVFLNRKGFPTKNSTYDTYLYKICDKAGIKHFSAHTMRHSFATRCVESGMNYKSLSMILGHSSIKITMDLYAHVTKDTKQSEMNRFAEYMKQTDL